MAAALIKYRAVEAPILNRFEQVVAFDFVDAGEIGDGAGDFQDAIVGAGGERELLHGLLQEIAER